MRDWDKTYKDKCTELELEKRKKHNEKRTIMDSNLVESLWIATVNF